MHIINKIAVGVLVFLSLGASAQDTVKVMQYNLLYYNSYNSFCTATNNNVDSKDTYLKTIIGYALPDIFTVNEIGESNATLDRLLNNVMNSDGRTNYARAARTNYGASSIINALYYNTDKLVLHSQNVVVTDLRDINLYTLYSKGDNLATGDTSWINCIVMHLDAGSYEEDAEGRAVEVGKLMNYLNAINKAGNYLVMGDFNVYTDEEACFQNLIAHANANIRFYDPINKTGDWSSNSSYAKYHTQSTHTADNGCAATGGLDDRFDHILASMDIITGNKTVKYIPDSYYALGQDGQHYNTSLIASPTNSSVPSNVLDALYNNSDHLPVILELLIDNTVGMAENSKYDFDFTCFSNESELVGKLISHINGNYHFSIYSIDGRLISKFDKNCTIGNNDIKFDNIQRTNRIMILSIESPDGEILPMKVVF